MQFNTHPVISHMNTIYEKLSRINQATLNVMEVSMLKAYLIWKAKQERTNDDYTKRLIRLYTKCPSFEPHERDWLIACMEFDLKKVVEHEQVVA